MVKKEHLLIGCLTTIDVHEFTLDNSTKEMERCGRRISSRRQVGDEDFPRVLGYI